jgi:hypothetical protein
MAMTRHTYPAIVVGTGIGGSAAAALLLGVTCACSPARYGVILRHGTIHDGSGAAPGRIIRRRR